MALPRMPAQGITYADYALLPDDGNRYEVLEGALTVSPVPRPRHQEIVTQLIWLLKPYVDEHRLGNVYPAPIDVLLSPQTIVQPGVVFVSRAQMEIVTSLNIQDAPDLCIEIVSPSSRIIDHNAKKGLYVEHGVREYWVIDPDRASVTRYTLEDGEYRDTIEILHDGEIRSTAISGFVAAASVIFD